MAATVEVFGIRHHGPGSARSLRAALQAYQPDCLLIEGPPEAQALLGLAGLADMQPPVALLIHASDRPAQAVYFPLAEYSPEWQALRYALEHNISVQLMDLPQAIQMALEREREQALEAALAAAAEAESTAQDSTPSAAAESTAQDSTPSVAAESTAQDDSAETVDTEQELIDDPLLCLAQAAGYEDSERWWEHLIEQRCDSGGVFQAIREAMLSLRETFPTPQDPQRARREALREAYMRQTLRSALKTDAQRIAVVCGAWHIPALLDLPAARADSALLKGLPKLKVNCTWIPWSYQRLSRESGYGAGVHAPGWYHYLWQHGAGERLAVQWLSHVAHCLRQQDLPISSAHIIEGVRLAEALAALRQRAQPDLQDLQEAALAVLCHGNPAPLSLIERSLLIADRLGQVPEGVPSVPLALDVAREQKRLRLPVRADEKTLDLDLRQDTDRERSQLLHRLRLLELDWAKLQPSSGKGTFKERWELAWAPELAIRLIELSVWGATVAEATQHWVEHQFAEASLAQLVQWLHSSLNAGLPALTQRLLQQLQQQAAGSHDVSQLMRAVPGLVEILRYDDARGSDKQQLETMFAGLVTRICIALPPACSSLDDDGAQAQRALLEPMHQALATLGTSEYLQAWWQTLAAIRALEQLHGLLDGYCTHLLFSAQQLDETECALAMQLGLASSLGPEAQIAWLNGFLPHSAQILLHNRRLWILVDDWLCQLNAEHFTELLPLLRRTFCQFAAAERRQIAELVAGVGDLETGTLVLDDAQAALGLPLLGVIFGLQVEAAT